MAYDAGVCREAGRPNCLRRVRRAVHAATVHMGTSGMHSINTASKHLQHTDACTHTHASPRIISPFIFRSGATLNPKP